MRIHLQALGCRLNEAELQQWADEFERVGHEITCLADDADLVVINTCAVTREACRKSRQLIRQSKHHYPQAKLVVSGCQATLERDKPLEVDLLIPNSDKAHLVQHIQKQWPCDEPKTLKPLQSTLFERNRTRAFIKVQDGCRWRCTYCIVTIARGDERSTAVKTIIEKINQCTTNGIQEIVLTGVHLGGYGADINCSLYSLVEHILQETDVPRIRFGSLEPWDIPEDFWGLFANPRLMSHVHLPLQSGCDSVLKRMARRCKTRAFAKLVASAKKQIPNLNITTDIIVGFPGETDQQWQQSYEFIKSMSFGHIHVFGFSAHPGTKAASLPKQISATTIKQRSQELQQLSNSMAWHFTQQQNGQVVEVLLESTRQSLDNEQMRYSGYTPNYLKIEYTSPDPDLKRKIIRGIVQCDTKGKATLRPCSLLEKLA